MVKNEKDFFAGLLLAVVGISFAWGAYANYEIGRASKMGPGYFPLLLGVILGMMGISITFKSFISGNGERIGRFAWRPLGFILGANLVFGILFAGMPSLGIPSFGLIVAIYALTFIASLAGNEFKFKEVFILATLLAVLSYFTFIKLLGLQFPAWPSFLNL